MIPWYPRSPFGNTQYDGFFTPTPNGDPSKLHVPEPKPFGSNRSSNQSLQVPNQNPSPLGNAPQKTFADMLASLNLPGLVENLGMTDQLTRPSVNMQGGMGQVMTEEQMVGRERLEAERRKHEENVRNSAEMLDALRRAGIIDSSRLVETDDD